MMFCVLYGRLFKKTCFTVNCVPPVCHFILVCILQEGRIAEEVALDFRHEEVAQFLQKERENAPGQFMYRDEKTAVNVWIGDKVSLCIPSGLSMQLSVCLSYLCSAD
jgi:hypothetical protein